MNDQVQMQERSGIRPEIVLGIIAALSAIALVVTLVLCMPYYFADEPQEQMLLDIPTETETVEESTEPEETVEETIPPEANPYGRNDFQYNRHNYLYCTKQESHIGVDVSFYQHDIDWKKVKASGVEYAMIRLGIRGWGKAGKLVEDEYAQKNLKEARAAGLSLGAYFYSQALTIEEVDQEIEFLLKILGKTPLDMPLVLDWEPVYEQGSRSQNMDRRTLTDLMLHFCQVVSEKGYQPMIYFNPNDGNRLFYLSELEEYPFWLAYYTDRMNYRFRVEMWQYTNKGRVPGINGDVDLNVFLPDARVKMTGTAGK